VSPGDPGRSPLTIFNGQALGVQSADWFTGAGFRRDQGARAVVSGTAELEYGEGARVAAYLKVWDRLGLIVTMIRSWTWADDTIGLVEASTAMPVTGKPGFAKLTFAAIVVRDGPHWKWVSLHWIAH
jgi:hypothetical protein